MNTYGKTSCPKCGTKNSMFRPLEECLKLPAWDACKCFECGNDYKHSEQAERLAKSPGYIKELCKLPDKKLSEWLDLVRAQQVLAIEQENEKAMTELLIREDEIIQARLIVNFD